MHICKKVIKLYTDVSYVVVVFVCVWFFVVVVFLWVDFIETVMLRVANLRPYKNLNFTNYCILSI